MRIKLLHVIVTVMSCLVDNSHYINEDINSRYKKYIKCIFFILIIFVNPLQKIFFQLNFIDGGKEGEGGERGKRERKREHRSI